MTAAMKEMTRALVNTIKESNRAISQNLNHVLEEVQRRQPQGQVTPARILPCRTDRVCRPGPRVRQPRYSRSGFSDSDEESGMYSTHRQSLYRDPAQERETTKLPILQVKSHGVYGLIGSQRWLIGGVGVKMIALMRFCPDNRVQRVSLYLVS